MLQLVAAAAISVVAGHISGAWWEYAFVALGVIGGAIVEIRVGPGSYISGAIVFSVLAAAFLGPLPAFLIVLSAAAIAGPIHRARTIAILGNAAGAAFPTVLCALVLDASLPDRLDSWSTPVILVGVSLLLWTMNMALNTAYFPLLDGTAPSEWLRPLGAHVPGIVLSSVFAGAVGAVYAESAATGIGFAFALMVALLFMTRQIAMSVEHTQRIGALAESRRVLAADAAQAEERERRRIAERLHDDVLQSLLAARQDIRSGVLGDRERLEAAETAVRAAVDELRDSVAQLHPAPTRAAGVAAMLSALADDEARHGGFHVQVAVAPDLDATHDRLLLGVARELLVNVARHAEAASVRVGARSEDGRVVLEVVDDGRGMRTEDRRRALAAGHVGLASLTERVEALGGSVTITSPTAGGRGTAIAVRLPRTP